MKTKSMCQRLAFTMALGLLLAGGTNQALAVSGLTLGTYAPGQPINGFIGWDGVGDATISLDELGNGSIAIGSGAFFGPYNVTVTHIASTVNPAWAGLEVTSYLVTGKGGNAQLELAPGVVGIGAAGGVGLSDALVFTNITQFFDPADPIFSNSSNGAFGVTRIDFLSDGENPFFMDVDQMVFENALDMATYLAAGSYAAGNTNEKITYNIDSSAPDNVPDAGATASLLGLAVIGLAAVRRKLNLA